MCCEPFPITKLLKILLGPIKTRFFSLKSFFTRTITNIKNHKRFEPRGAREYYSPLGGGGPSPSPRVISSIYWSYSLLEAIPFILGFWKFFCFCYWITFQTETNREQYMRRWSWDLHCVSGTSRKIFWISRVFGVLSMKSKV